MITSPDLGCYQPASRSHPRSSSTSRADTTSACLTPVFRSVLDTSVREDETSGRPHGREKMFDIARVIDMGSAGLPVGVQVVAGPGREHRALAVMQALEGSSGLPTTA
jgi:hypothetical protein